MSDIKTVTKKIFGDNEFKKIAEFIVDEFRRRQKKRNHKEKQWKEIDRQLRMEPDIKYKKTPGGKRIPQKAWMPELEISNQAAALEVLLSDVMNITFPDSEDFFRVRSNIDMNFLQRYEANTDLLINENTDLPTTITQENVDEVTKGWLLGTLRKFDYKGVWNLIHADALKYGDGIGKMRQAKMATFSHKAQGVFETTKNIQILAPVCIKDIFLDDREYSMAADGFIIAPSIIFHQFKKLEDILLAAKDGSADPDDPFGGWLKDNVKSIKQKKKAIEYIEYEGDIVLSESGSSTYIPNVIVTIAIGEKESKIIRFRFKDTIFSSYIHVPYHKEDITDPYSTSPLMKGLPIQKAASEALNRAMQAFILNTEPPIRYSRDDQYFRAKGGPVVYPGAQWASEANVDPVFIGDPAGLINGYGALLQQYSDVTGINAPRLGAQTISHTTAFAKDQEIQRGQVRTVDYVRSVLKGPMTKWLYLHFDRARELLDSEDVYVDKYGGFVNVSPEFIPEDIFLEVFGSAGPAESAAIAQARFQAILSAIQINQIAVQAGQSQPLNYDAIVRELLKQGNITDVDAFLETIPERTAPGPEIPGVVEGAGGPGAAAVALQGLQFGGGV